MNIIDINKHTDEQWKQFLQAVDNNARKDAKEGESWIKPKNHSQKELLVGVIFRCLRGLFAK